MVKVFHGRPPLGVRTNNEKYAKPFIAVATALSAIALLFVFQNCGSFDLGNYNPLLDSTLSSTCLGINCSRDLNTVRIRAGYSAYTLENATAVTFGACDAAQCIDVGGYCEAGGYPSSIFYYQWILTTSTGVETRTTTTCDENGRYHMQVHVPTGYDWAKINHLRIFMKVIDENHAEFTSPTGSGEFVYQVSTRSGS